MKKHRDGSFCFLLKTNFAVIHDTENRTMYNGEKILTFDGTEVR
jgi:hypothetical protein